MTKAIFIDSKNQTISPIEVTGLTDLQALVGGWIELGRCPINATLYVNEEANIKPFYFGFAFSGKTFPYWGNGVLIGLPDAEGADTDLTFPIETLKEMIIFTRKAT